MSIPKIGKSKSGELMHYSVGALIERDGKYLLIDRVNPPFGFAGLAGHIDEGEESILALKREVKEESGLAAVSCRFLFEEEIPENVCAKGIGVHYWYVFACDTRGELKAEADEVKSIGWYTSDEMRELSLEPVWKYWFGKLKLL